MKRTAKIGETEEPLSCDEFGNPIVYTKESLAVIEALCGMSLREALQALAQAKRVIKANAIVRSEERQNH